MLRVSRRHLVIVNKCVELRTNKDVNSIPMMGGLRSLLVQKRLRMIRAILLFLQRAKLPDVCGKETFSLVRNGHIIAMIK